MNTHYQVLGISPEANQQDIEAAYHRQCERYDPTHIADMDDEMRTVAEQRIAELEQAYRILSHPEQRQQYDKENSINSQEMTEGDLQHPQPSKKQSMSAKDRWFAIGGVLAGLLLVAIIWFVTGANDDSIPTAPEVHRPAPEFTLFTPDGEEVSLSDYRGKIVMVNFWGSWCDPCIREIPDLQTAYAALKDEGFVIIGVNLFDNEKGYDHSVADIENFVEQNGITYPVVLDVQGKVTDDFHVFPIPTSFFIDAQGNIRYVLPRELTTEEITAWFTKLKQEAPTSFVETN